MRYTIKDGGAVLGTFQSESSDPAVASGVASTLSLAVGTAISVHATTEGDYVASYDDTVLAVEAG
jgi:uncharacterized membrane protein (UPF0136 family)